MSDERDWADLLAWRFIGGFSENPRDVERWRETRKIVAAEFRKAKLDGLREAADMAFAYAAKQEPQWKAQGMGPSADINNFASGARHVAEHIRAHVDAIEKDNNG